MLKRSLILILDFDKCKQGLAGGIPGADNGFFSWEIAKLRAVKNNNPDVDVDDDFCFEEILPMSWEVIG